MFGEMIAVVYDVQMRLKSMCFNLLKAANKIRLELELQARTA